ncbi:hypothetical protein PanWU01x14_323200 [Parasponia andersonii]|uniref:Uncharacterized protein n=1 Tax=Parasponia andersonii TaxID=3476 RepID=A0A2P5AKS7_PARAD|nr:hypothetical protein PanWU01x14_323200 [Parasponia andersonii]
MQEQDQYDRSALEFWAGVVEDKNVIKIKRNSKEGRVKVRMRMEASKPEMLENNLKAFREVGSSLETFVECVAAADWVCQMGL